MIPKIIIQTGRDIGSLSMVERASRATLAALNPDFQCLFFNDADVVRFIDEHFPEYAEIFATFPVKIQKFDFFRYLAVYHYGGFYFDLDVIPCRPLTDLLQHDCVLSFEELSIHEFLRESFGMDWEVANYAFGASPRHPFIGSIIENCVRARREPEWPAQMWASIPRVFRREFYVLDTTGPGLVSRTLAEFASPEAVTVLFPPDVCEPSNWHKFGDYCVHLQEGGWRTRKGFWQRKLGSLWEGRLREVQLRAARKLGPKRALAFDKR